jgi:translation elongation factor EF-Tu-like GTPase
MVKIRAHIRLYENGRKTPFYSGYRPLFNFTENMKTSGKIDLIGRDKFHPGDEGEVEITFLNRDYLGIDFKIGKTFLFGEGVDPLGEGTVKEILLSP